MPILNSEGIATYKCKVCKLRWEEYYFSASHGGSYKLKRCRFCVRDSYWAHKYGMLPGDYARKYKAQKGLCMICKKPSLTPILGRPTKLTRPRELVQDHDHIRGNNRDLLCDPCNRGLGFFQDSPELLHRASNYLKRHLKKT